MKPIFEGALATVVTIFAVTASGALPRAGQQDPTGPVFTAEQAAAGKAAFAKACARCHLPDLSGNNEVPPLAGASFIDIWGARTMKELLDYMSGAMPPGGPAQTAETYESIVAYVLNANGADAGPNPLKASVDVPINRLVKTASN